MGQPTPVGSYPAGATPDGLMDMAGNVREWCDDWYEVGKYRVLRGGSFDFNVNYLRCSNRDRDNPDYRLNDVFGFRVACSH